MKIRLAYGKTGLEVNLRDRLNVEVVEPRYIPGISNPLAALRDALCNPIGAPPLTKLVEPGSRVGIVVNDITRPTPNQLMLQALLAELHAIPQENITIFIALGTHRPCTPAELEQMVGMEFAARCRIVQNNAFDPATQVHLGETSQGHPIWMNRELADCNLKILTGFIEPHFFAGFSGGGKAVMPGMAGLETTLGNHSASNIAHPKATWGVTHGNPIWEEVQETALKAGPLFLVNVTLNREKQITGIFAGALETAHERGVEFNRQTAMAPVDQAFDIVITTNSGYPLDLNLYQSVKGMSAAAQVVRPGGSIVIAAECWDGIPEHGLYGKLLTENSSPRALLDSILSSPVTRHDQWQAQIQAQIQLKADVYVYSGHLTEAQIHRALLKPAASIEQAVDQLTTRYGKDARICVLPEGPQTIPFIRR